MSQNLHLDPDQLVTYLYGECDPGERSYVESHLGECPACAEEVGALTRTRQQLAGWAPPDVALGFHITRTAIAEQETPPAPLVLVPGGERAAAREAGPWWSRPLPAWAQAAAAVLIFGAGLAIGNGRTAEAPAAPAPAPAVVTRSLVPAAPAAAPAADNRLARQVDELRAELAALRRAPVTVPAAAPSQPLLDQVRALIEESEQRQRIEFTARSAQLARDFEVQRRVDLAQVNQTLVRVQGQTGAEARQQRQAIEGLARAVSLGVR